MDYTHHYDSPLGGITMASDGRSLTGLWFDGQAHFGTTLSPEHEEKHLPVFEQADQWLDSYFSGKVPDCAPSVSLEGTPFQKAVWELLLTIPYGCTVTYGQLARMLNIPCAQAVGGAVARNPVSLIVPCHRVVGKNGSLTGYAGGIHIKRELLTLEKCDIYSK